VRPYTGAGCGTTSAHNVDVGAHYDVLKFATAPELRCPQCKHAMQCHAGETVMTLLPTMPRPTAGPELVKHVAVLRERALIAAGPRRSAKPVGTGPQAPVQAGSQVLVPVLVVLLAIVLAAGGVIAYQRVVQRPAGGLGSLSQRSAEARPAWIASDVPAAATCSDAP